MRTQAEVNELLERVDAELIKQTHIMHDDLSTNTHLMNAMRKIGALQAMENTLMYILEQYDLPDLDVL